MTISCADQHGMAVEHRGQLRQHGASAFVVRWGTGVQWAAGCSSKHHQLRILMQPAPPAGNERHLIWVGAARWDAHMQLKSRCLQPSQIEVHTAQQHRMC